MPEPTPDWGLLRIFLVTMRTSSLRAAAAALGISHPTVRRKLNQLEAQLGVMLFEHHSPGLRATAAADELLGAAEAVEATILALSRQASAMSPELDGEIRVSIPSLVATHLLMPDLDAFAHRWPQVKLRIEPTNQLVDLGRREADVAIRAMPLGQQPDDHLVGRLAGTVYAAVYGSDQQWIGWWADEREQARIAESAFPNRPVSMVMADVGLQLAACREGAGLAELPCFLADPFLERHTEPRPVYDLWVLVHPDLRRAARLRLFRDAMVGALASHRRRLEGTVAL